ncbi:MAG: outer membrane beta-barrel protein [Prevotella sp.]
MTRTTILTAMMSLIAAITLHAQPDAGTFSITPRIGVTLPDITGNPQASIITTGPAPEYTAITARTDDSRRSTGYYFGCDASYQITSLIGLTAGIGYSFQGTKYEDFEFGTATEADKPTIKICDTKTDLRYITFPVTASVYVAEGLAVKAGIQPAVCVGKDVKAKIVFPESGMDYESENDRISGFDLSIPVGLSYEYENVILDARYNIGVTDTYKNNHYDSAGSTASTTDNTKKHRNSVIMFTVGYKFSFR